MGSFKVLLHILDNILITFSPKSISPSVFYKMLISTGNSNTKTPCIVTATEVWRQSNIETEC